MSTSFVWIEGIHVLFVDDYRQKEVESVAAPIISKYYGQGGAGGGYDDDDDDDDDDAHDEL